jgi:hypothetical protein
MYIRLKSPRDELESMSLNQGMLRICFCKMCSKIHISCSHLQMELNCGKTSNVSSVTHTEFISTMRGCRADIEN